MADIKIPHAQVTFVETDPPRRILYVVTRLSEKPGTLGFNAEAKHEMLNAIAATQGAPDGFDGYKIHWSDSPNI
jgi:hypothetical protein